jgi:hypothetical protein
MRRCGKRGVCLKLAMEQQVLRETYSNVEFGRVHSLLEDKVEAVDAQDYGKLGASSNQWRMIILQPGDALAEH